jgi:hypothetical protein
MGARGEYKIWNVRGKFSNFFLFFFAFCILYTGKAFSFPASGATWLQDRSEAGCESPSPAHRLALSVAWLLMSL